MMPCKNPSPLTAYLFRYRYFVLGIVLIAMLGLIVTYFRPPIPMVNLTAPTNAPPQASPPPQIVTVPPQMTPSEHDLVEAKANGLPTPAATPTDAAPTPPAETHSPKTPEQYTADVQSQFSHLPAFKVIPDKVIPDADAPAQSSRVVIGFDLNREGLVQSKTLMQSSSNPEIDRDAMNILNRTGFAPFPSDVWSGETTHHFVITLAPAAS